MITLALYRQILKDGVADLHEGQRGEGEDDSRNFFWEEAPLQVDGEPASGVWLVSRGGDISGSRKNLNLRTTVDFYIATKDKVTTEQIHQEIYRYLAKTMYFCELSEDADDLKYHFSNVRIRPTSTPENAGATENGLIVKVASCLLVYDDDLQYLEPTLGGVILTENNKELLTEVGQPITTEVI